MTQFIRHSVNNGSLQQGSFDEQKGYNNARQFMIEFQDKCRTKNSVNRLLLKLIRYDPVDRCLSSGRQRIARTDNNADVFK